MLNNVLLASLQRDVGHECMYPEQNFFPRFFCSTLYKIFFLATPFVIKEIIAIFASKKE